MPAIKKPKIKREYEARLDSKRRFTLRSAAYDHYLVREFADGTILLEPRVLVSPDTLRRMTEDYENLVQGRVSEPVNDEVARLAREMGMSDV